MVYKAKLFRYAIYTRLFVLCLGIISNILIPDHDAGVFVAPLDPESPKSATFQVTNAIFGGFLRWDAQYFQHLARNGYTYENSLAFFPLFPMIGRGIAIAVNYIYPSNLDAAITLTFILSNNLFFIWALMALYDLTRLTFNTDRFAYLTGCLFIVNPATIFFVAPYTESLFAFLTFKAIYHSTFLRKVYHCLLAIFFTTLSTLTRSNGLLNIGYIIFFLIQMALSFYSKCSIKKIATLTKFALCISTPLAFFLASQLFHYYNFCTDFPSDLPNYIVSFGRKHNFVMPGEHSKHNQTWCDSLVPLSYGYIQEKYWNVGFMRYFEFKQIPNFLLAFPVLFIMLRNIIPYLIKNRRNIFNFSLFKIIKDADYKGTKCRSDIVMACFLHATFLTVFSIFYVHIQVSTRMILSANPAFYWISAYYFKGFRIEKPLLWQNITNKKQLFLLLYSFSYIIIGTILFCNFLPWT